MSVQIKPPRLSMSDLEASELGRDGRFQPGWWIIPGLLITVAMFGLLSKLV